MRKSPIKHKVKAHKKKSTVIHSYVRGKGQKSTKLAKPKISSVSSEGIKIAFRRSVLNDKPTKDYIFKDAGYFPQLIGSEGGTSIYLVTHKPTGTKFVLKYNNYRGFTFYEIEKVDRNYTSDDLKQKLDKKALKVQSRAFWDGLTWVRLSKAELSRVTGLKGKDLDKRWINQSGTLGKRISKVKPDNYFKKGDKVIFYDGEGNRIRGTVSSIEERKPYGFLRGTQAIYINNGTYGVGNELVEKE